MVPEPVVSRGISVASDKGEKGPRPVSCGAGQREMGEEDERRRWHWLPNKVCFSTEVPAGGCDGKAGYLRGTSLVPCARKGRQRRLVQDNIT